MLGEDRAVLVLPRAAGAGLGFRIPGIDPAGSKGLSA